MARGVLQHWNSKVQALNSLHPAVRAPRLVSGQKQWRLRPFWPTYRQYPFQLALEPFFYSLSHRRWSVFADSVKLWGGNTRGEVSVPLCLNAWDVTYLEAVKGKMVGVESQFSTTLLGQNHLLQRGKEDTNEGCLPLLTYCLSADPAMDAVGFMAKSIAIHGSYSVIPNRMIGGHCGGLSPSG